MKLVSINKTEEYNYNRYFTYLKLRNRYGVISCEEYENVKEFYIIPWSEGSDLPNELLPLDGSGSLC